MKTFLVSVCSVVTLLGCQNSMQPLAESQNSQLSHDSRASLAKIEKAFLGLVNGRLDFSAHILIRGRVNLDAALKPQLESLIRKVRCANPDIWLCPDFIKIDVDSAALTRDSVLETLRYVQSSEESKESFVSQILAQKESLKIYRGSEGNDFGGTEFLVLVDASGKVLILGSGYSE